MDNYEPKAPHTISWWITSLATSITCCAILFVIFAGYLSEIKKSIASENAQLTQMVVHEEQLLAEMQSLHRAIAAPPAAAATPSPTAAAPAPAPPAANAPAPLVPPAAAPTAVPEVAPKH